MRSPPDRNATESPPQRAAARALIAKGAGAPVSACTQSPCAQGIARPKGGSPRSTAKLESAAARSALARRRGAPVAGGTASAKRAVSART